MITSRRSLMFAALGYLVLGVSAAHAEAANLNHTTNLIDEMGPAPAAPREETDRPQFARVIDDLPLMKDLELVEDDDVLFATSQAGRIAVTEAVGAVDIDDVYKFYRRTLPQMGWSIIDRRSYRRENETLRIDARADDKMTRVRFSVQPSDK